MTCCTAFSERWLSGWLQKNHGVVNQPFAHALEPLPTVLQAPELHIRVVALQPDGGLRFPLNGHLCEEARCNECGKLHTFVLMDGRMMLLVFYGLTQAAILFEGKHFRRMTAAELRNRDDILATYLGAAPFVEGQLDSFLDPASMQNGHQSWAQPLIRLFHRWSLLHEIAHAIPSPNSILITASTEDLKREFGIHESVGALWVAEISADLTALIMLEELDETYRSFLPRRNHGLNDIVSAATAACSGLSVLLAANKDLEKLEAASQFRHVAFRSHPPISLRRRLITAQAQYNLLRPFGVELTAAARTSALQAEPPQGKTTLLLDGLQEVFHAN